MFKHGPSLCASYSPYRAGKSKIGPWLPNTTTVYKQMIAYSDYGPWYC